jgi:hypothetical protein
MLDGGHRIATVLMYLSTVKMGGEIIFPNSEVTYLLTLVLALVSQRQILDCMSSGLLIQPFAQLSQRLEMWSRHNVFPPLLE